jgi:hypothetical protein
MIRRDLSRQAELGTGGGFSRTLPRMPDGSGGSLNFIVQCGASFRRRSRNGPARRLLSTAWPRTEPPGLGSISTAKSCVPRVTPRAIMEVIMDGIIYLVGFIVIIMAILSFLGLH